MLVALRCRTDQPVNAVLQWQLQPLTDRVGRYAIIFSWQTPVQYHCLALIDLLTGVKYRIRQICPILLLSRRPLLFIWTLGCVQCGVIGLLLVVKKLLMVGLASLDQSTTDSCPLEPGFKGRATPPYLLTWLGSPGNFAVLPHNA